MPPPEAFLYDVQACVDKHMNCEDIAMSFLVANLTEMASTGCAEPAFAKLDAVACRQTRRCIIAIVPIVSPTSRSSLGNTVTRRQSEVDRCKLLALEVEANALSPGRSWKEASKRGNAGGPASMLAAGLRPQSKAGEIKRTGTRGYRHYCVARAFRFYFFAFFGPTDARGGFSRKQLLLKDNTADSEKPVPLRIFSASAAFLSPL